MLGLNVAFSGIPLLDLIGLMTSFDVQCPVDFHGVLSLVVLS